MVAHLKAAGHRAAWRELSRAATTTHILPLPQSSLHFTSYNHAYILILNRGYRFRRTKLVGSVIGVICCRRLILFSSKFTNISTLFSLSILCFRSNPLHLCLFHPSSLQSSVQTSSSPFTGVLTYGRVISTCLNGQALKLCRGPTSILYACRAWFVKFGDMADSHYRIFDAWPPSPEWFVSQSMSRSRSDTGPTFPGYAAIAERTH